MRPFSFALLYALRRPWGRTILRMMPMAITSRPKPRVRHRLIILKCTIPRWIMDAWIIQVADPPQTRRRLRERWMARASQQMKYGARS